MKSGADNVQARDYDRTPLFIAAAHGREAAVSVLVGVGAAIDVVTDEQCTPWFVAAQKGNEGLLAVLIKAGEDVNRTNDGRITTRRCWLCF
jgi:ankyrin repeat protein